MRFKLLAYGISFQAAFCLTEEESMSSHSHFQVDTNREARLYATKQTVSFLRSNQKNQDLFKEKEVIADDQELLKKCTTGDLKKFVEDQFVPGKQLNVLKDVEVVTFAKQTELPHGVFQAGERDVQARRDLSAFYCFGIYDGFLGPPQPDKAKAFIVWLGGEEMAMKKMAMKHAFSYTLGLRCNGLYGWTIYPITLSVPHLINAPCNHTEAKCTPSSCTRKSNVRFSVVWFKDHNMPVVLYFTSRPVKAGESLLVGYGKNYWKRKEETQKNIDKLTLSAKKGEGNVFRFMPTLQTQDSKPIKQWELEANR